jgi:hypothetical protein
MSIRNFMNIINEDAGHSPDVQIKNGSLKTEKIIIIDGEQCGMMRKSSRDSFQGYNDYKKTADWRGEFTFDGATIDVGPTEKVAEIAPKVIRLIRGHLARKQQTSR